jgi:hypothetical protein
MESNLEYGRKCAALDGLPFEGAAYSPKKVYFKVVNALKSNEKYTQKNKPPWTSGGIHAKSYGFIRDFRRYCHNFTQFLRNFQ